MMNESDDVDPASGGEFKAWYNVQVTGASKDGLILKYNLLAKKLDQDGKEVSLVREYEDFQWLQHSLITSDHIEGVILPPLPPKPVITASGGEAKSKKTLGSKSRSLLGDDFARNCKAMETYLQQLVQHSAFGKNEILANFLTQQDAPIRTKLKKSLFSSLTKAVEEVRKANHKDVDPFFQHERDACNQQALLMKETSANFGKMNSVGLRVCSALGDLTTALQVSSTVFAEIFPKTGEDGMLSKFSEAMNDYCHGFEVNTVNNDKTLGFALDLYSRYTEEEKEMLYRRTCKLIQLENATKTAEKAKPAKKMMEVEKRDELQKEFDSLSATAQKEIKKFHRQRIVSYQKALVLYAEAQIKTARDTYALLAKDLNELKMIKLGGGGSGDN